MKRLFYLMAVFVFLLTIKVEATTKPPLEPELISYIEIMCVEYGISVPTFYGLMDVETGGTFDSNLVSKTNDHGITQINGRYAEYFCEVLQIPFETFDPYNPYHSVNLSVRWLHRLQQQYVGNYTGESLRAMMLSAYNMGNAGAERQPSEYTSYSKEVIKRSKKYMEDFENEN